LASDGSLHSYATDWLCYIASDFRIQDLGMGTMQQITIGAVCVGGAFLLGHFLNNQTPPETHPESVQHASTTETPNPFAFPDRKDQTALLPNYRTQSSLGFDDRPAIDLPPPSQLDSGKLTAKKDASQNVIADADQELDIEVPDFSSLAAQFKGTLLELPALNRGQAPVSHVATNSSSTGDNGNSSQKSQAADRNTDTVAANSMFPARHGHQSENENPLIPKIQLTVAPPDYEAEDRMRNAPANPLPLTSSGFQLEDFAPQLRGDGSVNSSKTSSSPSSSHSNIGSGLSILEQTGSAGNLIEPFHPNAVVSYNDPFPARNVEDQNRMVAQQNTDQIQPGQGPSAVETSGRHDSNVARQARGLASETSETPTNQDRSETNSASSIRNVPFGLNDDHRNRLSRLTNSSSQVDNLPAVRYENYQTQMGDSLHSISLKFYGTSDYYLDIYLANRHRLRNPADVPSGITLRIPIYN
jgi:hypothetical protein